MMGCAERGNDETMHVRRLIGYAQLSLTAFLSFRTYQIVFGSFFSHGKYAMPLECDTARRPSELVLDS